MTHQNIQINTNDLKRIISIIDKGNSKTASFMEDTKVLEIDNDYIRLEINNVSKFIFDTLLKDSNLIERSFNKYTNMDHKIIFVKGEDFGFKNEKKVYKNKRKGIPNKSRFEIFKRDSFTCQYCGQGSPEVILNVDHINPVKNGGDNDFTNLITSCFDCNSGKGARLLKDGHVIKKQKKSLDDLQERRNQIEMMHSWKQENSNLDDLEVSKIKNYLNNSWDCELTDRGALKMKGHLKKNGADCVYEAIDLSFSQYFDKHGFEHVLDKLGGILYNMKNDTRGEFYKIYKKSEILFEHFYLDSQDWKAKSIISHLKTINKEYSLESMESLGFFRIQDYSRDAEGFDQWLSAVNPTSKEVKQKKKFITITQYDYRIKRDNIELRLNKNCYEIMKENWIDCPGQFEDSCFEWSILEDSDYYLKSLTLSEYEDFYKWVKIYHPKFKLKFKIIEEKNDTSKQSKG